ncbi:MAG: ribonuclease R [Bacteroidetes bacterium]|nr:ribonuclease R [Bacteroidota bacterium]
MKHTPIPKKPAVTLEAVRGAILELLQNAGEDHLKSNEISKALGIKSTEPAYDLVREALETLAEEGLIFRTTRRRYGFRVPHVVIEGRLENLKSGWRVVSREDPATIFEVDQRLLWTGMHGDTVRAKMIAPSRPGGEPRGEVTRVLERANATVVGTLKKGRGLYVDPDERRIHRTITIPRRWVAHAKPGDKVVARLMEWNDPDAEPEGRIETVLGRAGEMNAEIAAIAASHKLPHVFTDSVLAEADAFGSPFTAEDLYGRRDLREMTIVTIDPVDARDFDDAISIEEHEDGDVTLGIHIADVAHYVREGSELDREALRRGTSVYLVTGVIPMLPERLSNDLCSLRPHEDRLAFSVFARLSPHGAVKGYEIVKSVINSKRRFTYEEALDVLQTGRGDFAMELLAINRIVHVLRANRRRKGSVDFDRPEMKFRLDENNHPVEVIEKRATESTRLIEDCMLLANRIVAEHIGGAKKGKDTRNPFIYRIHDVPPKAKLMELADFVATLGYSLSIDNVRPKDIQRLLEQARGTDEEELINDMALRSMAKAVYSEFNVGHFGLAFTHYTHFTSPIRRYPDLLVHRLLAEYAAGMNGARRQWYMAQMGEIADHCSERERAAVDAERESVKIAQVEFLKDHVGDVFEATVAGVMPFGLFAELKGFGIEGLVRLRAHEGDYYVYDERTRSFRGLRTKRSYRTGDAIHVRVIRVDEIRSEIDMELIEEEEYRAEMSESGPVRTKREHVAADESGFTLAELMSMPPRAARKGHVKDAVPEKAGERGRKPRGGREERTGAAPGAGRRTTGKRAAPKKKTKGAPKRASAKKHSGARKHAGRTKGKK